MDATPGDAGADAGSCADGCDDGIPCTVDRCVGDSCEHVLNDSFCREAPGGRCQGALGCQYPTCDRSTCIPGPCETAECQDNICVRGPGCTELEQCCGNACVPLGCGDDNPCTLDRCEADGCVNEPTPDLGCDDGDACTESDQCTADGQCLGALVTCPDDSNECTDAACINGACTQLCNSRSCNDRNPCTMGDRCIEGVCAGSPVTCGPGRRCENGGCVECTENAECTNTCNASDCAGCGATCVPQCSSGTCGCDCS